MRKSRKTLIWKAKRRSRNRKIIGGNPNIFEIWQSNMTAKEIIQSGVDMKTLILGKSIDKLIKRGFELKDIKPYFTLKEFGEVMFGTLLNCSHKLCMKEYEDYETKLKSEQDEIRLKPEEVAKIKEAFTLQEIYDTGIRFGLLKKDFGFTDDMLKSFVKDDKSKLQDLRNRGATVQMLKPSGKYELKDFLNTYFDYSDLLKEYSLEDLKKNGAILNWLKRILPLKEVSKVYKIEELKKDYTQKELSEVYSLKDIKQIFTLQELNNNFNLEQLSQAYTATELFDSGLFTYGEIKPYVKDTDKKTLEKLLENCKKNITRKTNLMCKYDTEKKTAINPSEKYP